MTADEFWSKVDSSAGHRACWPWTGYRNGRGYGQVRFEGREQGAHRVAYYLHTGQRLLPKIEIMHTCNNKLCCNPRHLIAGSGSDNTAAAFRDGLHRNDKQTAARMRSAAAEIFARHANGVPFHKLAAEYGVHLDTIRNTFRQYAVRNTQYAAPTDNPPYHHTEAAWTSTGYSSASPSSDSCAASHSPSFSAGAPDEQVN